MIIGFTGTRAGLTEAQRGALAQFLRAWHVMAVVHGDAIGADAQFDALARELHLPRVLRPCIFDKQRAHCERFPEKLLKVYAPLDPLTRNTKIVDDAHIVLAAPAGPETQRSGTWATVRAARRARKHRIIVYPSGQILHEQ